MDRARRARRTNRRAKITGSTEGRPLLRHFFPVSRSDGASGCTHKYTLPVNKISRPHKKDPRAVYRTLRYSCVALVRSLPRSRAHALARPPARLFAHHPSVRYATAILCHFFFSRPESGLSFFSALIFFYKRGNTRHAGRSPCRNAPSDYLL